LGGLDLEALLESQLPTRRVSCRGGEVGQRRPLHTRLSKKLLSRTVPQPPLWKTSRRPYSALPSSAETLLSGDSRTHGPLLCGVRNGRSTHQVGITGPSQPSRQLALTARGEAELVAGDRRVEVTKVSVADEAPATIAEHVKSARGGPWMSTWPASRTAPSYARPPTSMLSGCVHTLSG